MDALARSAHEAWLYEKRRRLDELGLPRTWIAENGEEQLVSWDELSESVREFDRIVVRAMLVVLDDRDLLARD